MDVACTHSSFVVFETISFQFLITERELIYHLPHTYITVSTNKATTERKGELILEIILIFAQTDSVIYDQKSLQSTQKCLIKPD